MTDQASFNGYRLNVAGGLVNILGDVSETVRLRRKFPLSVPPNSAHPVRDPLPMLTPGPCGALFATPLAGMKENTSMAEGDLRPVEGFAIATHLVTFIFGVVLAIVVLFAGIVTPPI